MGNLISTEKANKVYDILVHLGGAYEQDRSRFVYHHCESKDGCYEWRFGGKLGFGGKYWCETNCVACYEEDRTKERLNLIAQINAELSAL